MQLLNSNIPQSAQTTKYSNKKAQDLQNLVLFCCVGFSYYKDGGGEESRTPVLRKNKTTFYILSIRLISFTCRPDTGYKIVSVLKSPLKSKTTLFKAFPVLIDAAYAPDGKKRSDAAALITQRKQDCCYILPCCFQI